MSRSGKKFLVFLVATIIVFAAMTGSISFGTDQNSLPTEFAERPNLDDFVHENSITTISNSSLNVRVGAAIDGYTNIALAKDRRPFLYTERMRRAALSPLVKIKSTGVLNNGQVSFELDGQSEASEPSVYVLGVGATSFDRLDTTVNSENNTVTAPLSGVGTYVVLDSITWSNQAGTETSIKSLNEEINGEYVDPSTIRDVRTDAKLDENISVPHLSNRSVHGELSIHYPRPDSTVHVYLETANGERVDLLSVEGNQSIAGTTQEYSILSALPDSTGGEATLSLAPTNGSSVHVGRLSIVADSDGDGYTNTMETAGFQTAFGRIYTDPLDNDTDGDGLNDNQEIVRDQSAESGVSYRLVSDPNSYDSDLDGLSDATEIGSKPKIAYTDSALGTDKVFYYQKHSGQPEYNVSLSDGSNPLEPDTDGDGVNDLLERKFQTDPANVDTDVDNIPDGVELVYSTDPSLHDSAPPFIKVYQKSSHLSLWPLQMEHRVIYYVEDPAGISLADLTSAREFANLEYRNTTGTSQYTSDTSKLITATYSTWIFTDPPVEVFASDRNSNSDRTSNLEQPQATGVSPYWLAGEVPEAQNVYANGFRYGIRSFISDEIWSVINAPANTYDFFKALAEDPRGMLGSGIQTLQALAQRDAIDRLLLAFDATLEKKQAEDNPYQRGSFEYNMFESGWRAGFAIPLVLSFAAGGAKSTTTGTKLLTKVDDLGSATSTLRRVARVPDRILSSVRYGGARYNVQRAQRGLSLETLLDLEDADPAHVSRYLELGGRPAARALDQHPGVRHVLISKDPEIDPEIRVDAALMVARASNDKSISSSQIDSVATRIAANGPERAQMYQLLALDGPDHSVLRFMAESEESQLRSFLELGRYDGVDNGDLARYARKTGPGEVAIPLDELQTRLDSVRYLGHSGRTSIVEGDVSGTSVAIRYPDDEGSYLNNEYRVNDGSIQNTLQRAEITEGTIAPRVAESKGYTLLSVGDKDITTEGIDLIARSPDGDIVIIEAKYTGKDGTIGKSVFSSSRTGPSGEVYQQMTPAWIESAFRQASRNDVRSYDEVEAAIESGTYRREVIVVQNSRSGSTISRSFGSRADHVDLIKLSGVEQASGVRRPSPKLVFNPTRGNSVSLRGSGYISTDTGLRSHS